MGMAGGSEGSLVGLMRQNDAAGGVERTFTGKELLVPNIRVWI
jgi:hypothetical protein